MWAGRRVTVRYGRAARRPVTRLLDPLGLVLKTDVWYLVAAHRRQVRTYRLSRVGSVREHEDGAWRPAGFSLPEYWAQSRQDFEASIYALPVRLCIPAGAAGSLRAAVPGPHTGPALAAARPAGAEAPRAVQTCAIPLS